MTLTNEQIDFLKAVHTDPDNFQPSKLAQAYNLAAEQLGREPVTRFADRAAAMRRTFAIVDAFLSKPEAIPAFLMKDAVVSKEGDHEEDETQPEAQPEAEQATEQPVKKAKVKLPPSANRDAYWASEKGQAHIAKLREFAAARKAEKQARKEAEKAAKKAQREAAKAAKAK